MNPYISRRRWVVALALGYFAAVAHPLLVAREPGGDEPVKSIQLTIDYGDGVQKVFRHLSWTERMTVLDALELAARHPRGIKYTHQGSGATVFVTAIDDLKNEGTGRNWLYDVNGKPANKSSGVWELKADDKVVWRFAKQE